MVRGLIGSWVHGGLDRQNKTKRFTGTVEPHEEMYRRREGAEESQAILGIDQVLDTVLFPLADSLVASTTVCILATPPTSELQNSDSSNPLSNNTNTSSCILTCNPIPIN
jgi:hypothetical protein